MRYRRHEGNVTGFAIEVDPVAQIRRRVVLARALLRVSRRTQRERSAKD